MAKAIKLKNENYLDSSSVTHRRKKLSDILYPIGSIYMSVNSTSPAELFGGTWTQIKGRFLYCTDTSKTTGGNSTHTHTTQGHVLSGDEIPEHYHSGIYWYGAYPVAVDGGGQNTNRMQLYTDGNASTAAQLKTGVSGGGKSHYHGDTGSSSNLPPYFTVYCWYREA